MNIIRYTILMVLLSTFFGCRSSSVVTSDTTLPTVSSVSPSNGAVDVAIDATIYAEFSEQMDENTLSLNLSGGGISVDGTQTYTDDSGIHRLTFDPIGNLLNNTTYTIAISELSADAAGNKIASAASWSFTTVESGENPEPEPEPEPCVEGVLCISTTSLANAHSLEAYSQEIVVQSGTGTGYTWRITVGALPEGISIDGNNNVLTWGTFSLAGYVDYSAEGLAANDMTEISGLAVSRLNDGVLWVIDDSGNGADLFAISYDGSFLQKYTISNATNHDWEDMAIGKGPDSSKEYLYIGDFGDNSASRSNYQIIRVEEPSVPAERGNTISITGDTFYFTYPDGAKNCEAMLMDWEDSIIYLVQKTNGTGLVYKFPSSMDSSWDAAHPVGLTQTSGSGIVSGLITGGAVSRDNERIMIRQYNDIWEYARPEGAVFDEIFNTSSVSVDEGNAKSQQYETIAYSDNGATIYTITEKDGGSNIPIYKSVAASGSSTTTISGTPSLAGSYSFTVQVKDSAGDTASRSFVLEVE